MGVGMNKKFVMFNLLMLSFFVILGSSIYFGLKHKTTIIIQDDTIPNDYIGEFEITFYTHTGNNTSTGVYPKINRTVAVDTSVIPYNTILYIKGYGIYIAEDSGADIKGKRLDIFLNSKEECIKNGRIKSDVYILGKI
jgi:3D (Asp-Asp-Asp) domain-containing protein